MDLGEFRHDWRLSVGVISGGHFLSHFYIMSFPPLFPLWRAEFGLTNVELGLIMSASLVASLLQVPVGALVDRVGAKYVFVGGVGITALGIVLVGFATSFLGMLGFAIFSGIGQSTFHPADYAMIDASATDENLGKSFSLHSFGGYAGFAAAPVVVGGLALLTTWREALIAVGVIGVAYALFAGITLTPRYRDAIQSEPVTDDRSTTSSTRPPIRARLRALSTPSILIMFSFFLTFTIGLKGIQTFTPILLVDMYGYLESIGNSALTVFFATATIGILVGGVLSDRYDPRALLVVSLIACAALVWIGTAIVFELGGVEALGLFAVAGLIIGVIYPSRDSLVSQYSTAGSAGKSFGLVFTGTTVGGLISPPALGYVIDFSSPAIAFLIIGVAFFLAAGIILVLSTVVVHVDSAAPSGSD